MQYRLNLGLLLVSHVVSLSGLVYLWIAVYSSGQTIGSYSLQEILFYYIVLALLHLIIANGVGMGFGIASEINEGVVTNYLLKPFSYGFVHFLRLCGEATINFLFVTPFVAILLFLFRNTIEIPGIIVWLQFFAMIVVGIVFDFLVYYIGSLSSFWLTNGRSIIYAFLVASNLLDGSLMPIDTFPVWFQQLSAYLPFQFLFFLPIQTFLGRVDNWGQLLLTAVAWFVILFGVIVIMWKRGVRSYEAVGR